MKSVKCKHCGHVPFESIESILGDKVIMLTCRECGYGVHVPLEDQEDESLSAVFTHMSVVAKQTQKAIAKWNELNGVPDPAEKLKSLVEKVSLVIAPMVIKVFEVNTPQEVAIATVNIAKSIADELVIVKPKKEEKKEERMSLVDMMASIISDTGNSSALTNLAKSLSDEMKKQEEQKDRMPESLIKKFTSYNIPIEPRDKIALMLIEAFRRYTMSDVVSDEALKLADQILNEVGDKKEPVPCPHCGSKPTEEVVANEYRLQCAKCNVRVEIPIDLSRAIKLASSPDPRERAKAWDATFPMATDVYKELVEKWNNLWK
jgi:transcription elongation factor Elf1